MGYIRDNDADMMGYGLYKQHDISMVGYTWEYTGYIELNQLTKGIQATEIRDNNSTYLDIL